MENREELVMTAVNTLQRTKQKDRNNSRFTTRNENPELERKIRSVLSQKENVVLENNPHGIQLRCILRREGFEKDNEEWRRASQHCDGYTYK